MRQNQIDPRVASVAATFYEPVYQRLRLWHRGRETDLFCFVRRTSDDVRTLLAETGAAPCKDQRANCFAEVWEIPHSVLLSGPHGLEPANFDQKLVELLRCQDGQLSERCGTLQWSDYSDEEYHRNHVPSRLLQEATTKRGRPR